MKKHKAPNPIRVNQIVRCVEYLEKHGGRLTQSCCKTKWPDGTVTYLSWQYLAGNTGVLSSKTAIGAIKQHMEAEGKLLTNKNR